MTSAKNVQLLATVTHGDTMIDLAEAKIVEVIHLPDGRLWINVDGACLLRIKEAKKCSIEISDA